MSTIINADTSNGLKLTSDTSGQLELQSAGSTKVTMDTSGNVGIGTGSPNKSLSSTALTVDTPVAANYAALELSSGETLNWHINANNANVYDVTAGTRNRVFYTNGSERMRIDSNGKVGIGGTPSEPLSVFRTGGQEEGINIRNTSSGNGSRLTFETTRSDDSSVQDMAAIQVYAVAGYDSAANSDAIMTFQTQDSGTTAERMRIQSNGDVLVGVTSAIGAGSEGIQLKGNLGYISTARNTTTSASHHIFYNPNGIVGSIATAGSATTYGTSSDYRLKENVAPMSNSIDRLKQLKPSTWAWIQDGSHGEGFLAHEAQTVVPECAIGTKDAMKTEEYEVTPAVLDDEDNVVTEAVMGTREVPDYQGIDQSKLVPLLTAALQEAVTKIEDLETRIEALENA